MMSRPACKAVGCSGVAFNNLFCLAHWRAVPADLQRRIHAALGQWGAHGVAHQDGYWDLVQQAIVEVEKFERQLKEKAS